MYNNISNLQRHHKICKNKKNIEETKTMKKKEKKIDKFEKIIKKQNEEINDFKKVIIEVNDHIKELEKNISHQEQTILHYKKIENYMKISAKELFLLCRNMP